MAEKKANEKRTNINDAFCKTVKEDGMRIDSQDSGFCLRVRGDSKVFIARAKLRGTRQTVLVTIGPYPKYHPDDARKKSNRYLCDLAKGINPSEVKKEAVAKVEAETAAVRWNRRVRRLRWVRFLLTTCNHGN